MKTFIRTLTGDISPDSLGPTLIHEHLCVDWGEMVGRPKIIDFEYDAMVERMVAKMKALHQVGIEAMVDCTPGRLWALR